MFTHRAVKSWHGPQGYIVLPGPIGMGAVDIYMYIYSTKKIAIDLKTIFAIYLKNKH